MPNLEQYSDDCASDKDEQEYVYAESEQEIVDETIRPSPGDQDADQEQVSQAGLT